jgi:hypothetical protein
MKIVKMIVNNTNQNLTPFMAEIRQSLQTAGVMPEQLADLITVTFIEVNNETRAILNMA